MTRILIAEDHPVMSSGIAQLLRKTLPDVHTIEVDNFRKALDAARNHKFDLAIIDISMPGGDSVRMMEIFKQHCPALPVLIFSTYDEQLYALPFIKAGAKGFLSKTASEAEFRNAVETVYHRKRTYMSEALWDANIKRITGEHDGLADSIEALSLKERQVAQLLLNGKGGSEIAAIMNVSPSTVNTYRVRIFRKIGVNNVLQLAHRLEVLSSGGASSEDE